MLRYVAYLILAEEMDLHFPFLRKFSYTNIFGINRMSTLHALTVEVCIETEISLGPTKCQRVGQIYCHADSSGWSDMKVAGQKKFTSVNIGVYWVLCVTQLPHSFILSICFILVNKLLICGILGNRTSFIRKYPEQIQTIKKNLWEWVGLVKLAQGVGRIEWDWSDFLWEWVGLVRRSVGEGGIGQLFVWVGGIGQKFCGIGWERSDVPLEREDVELKFSEYPSSSQHT